MPNIISLEFHALDIYDLAIYNNNIPLLDDIIIKNCSDYNLKNLEVEISTNPSIFTTFVNKIPEISSGRYVVLSEHDLEIDTTKIMYSVKPTASQLTVKIKNMGEVLAESSKSVLLLPYDHISPVSTYTELLASYVTPEQNEIKNVENAVLENLKTSTDTPINRDMWDLSDADTTKNIIKAIYNTVKDFKITLNTTNILSETRPIQIKLPETTLATKSGNGFEIALLVSSIAEFLGLHTFITFASDKTLVGFFYSNDSFKTCVSDDGRSFVELKDGRCNRFCVIDTTSLMNGTQIAFENSLITAQKALDDCEYPIVVDIYRSRLSGYKSLPNRIRQNGNIIFEMSHFGTLSNNNSSNSSAFKSAESLSAYFKRNVFNEKEITLPTSTDEKRSIYLIGNVKYVLGKMFLNGKISLKSFPLSNFVDDNTDFFEKLTHLNDNIENSDISVTVNTFHEKDSLNRRMISVLNDSKEEFATICLSLGSVRYLYNGHKYVSPLFLAPVNFDYDTSTSTISLKFLTDNVVFNTTLSDVFYRAGINVDTFDHYSDVIERYTHCAEFIKNVFDDNSGFEFYDAVSISVYNVDRQTLSSIATPEFFEKSNILTKMFNSIPLEDNTIEGDVSEIDMPFSMDSSQMKAYVTAMNNECSVIKGANGSGKTRVAASIAFANLREGKKVLYLTNSEGNARDFMDLATQAKFNDFVMNIPDKNKCVNSFEYLHNQITHKDVANELSENSRNLSKLISDQNSYYQHLHKVNEIGFSLYEAASQYERYRSFPYSVNFINSDIAKLSRDDVVGWFDSVSSISKAGADCKEPYSNPLSFIGEKNFSYDLKSQSTILLNSHISLTRHFILAQNQLSESIGVEIPIMKEAQTETLIQMLNMIISESEWIRSGIFGRSDIESDFAKIEAMVFQCDDLFELKEFLLENFTEDVISLDCDTLLSEWRAANSKFAFARSSALSLVKNKLKAYALNSKLVTNDNFVDLINKIARYKNAVSLTDDSAQILYQIMGIDIKSMISAGERKVFEDIRKAVSTSQRYLSLINDLYDSEQAPNAVYLHQNNLFKNTEKLVSDIKKSFFDFPEIYAKYRSSENALVDLLKIDISKAKEENSKIWYYFVEQFLNRMLDNIDYLKYWCNWNVEKEKAISLGLENVIKLYENEQITSNDIKNAFLKGFFKAVTEYFLSCEDDISSFSSEKQKEDITNIYFALDRYRGLLSDDLKFKVYSVYEEYIRKSAFSSSIEAEDLLKRTFSYGIASYTSMSDVELLQKAKPCFLCMSPKFITSFKELPSFDTVIIDSTSEKMQDSLYLLLPLAKNVVIIDTDNGYSNRANFAKIFIEKGAPVVELSWLYNTNYSSSMVNELFYQNRLSTFVCTKHKKNGLSVVNQLGSYDRKKTRVNVIEASAVVDEIIKVKSDNPTLSIGVYTMTEEQRALVEMLFYKRIGTIDTVKESVNIKTKEPFFIRNFNQGEYDPRDIIIFSSVFSAEIRPKYKDSITKTIPELSKSSSITNLLHILTSARSHFTLISSLTPETLEEFKTTEKNYCIFKKAILRLISDDNISLQDVNAVISNENSIIREVANHIESLGYKADLHVGTNNCIIDIAVKSKGASQYLLGIVFDETAYVNSDGFIGRDLIKSGLETFGKWKLLRVYTVEWFENYSKQLDIISSALKGDEFQTDFL